MKYVIQKDTIRNTTNMIKRNRVLSKHFEFDMISRTRGIAQSAARCPGVHSAEFGYPHEYANRGDSVTCHRACLLARRRLRNSFSCASAEVGKLTSSSSNLLRERSRENFVPPRNWFVSTSEGKERRQKKKKNRRREIRRERARRENGPNISGETGLIKRETRVSRSNDLSDMDFCG